MRRAVKVWKSILPSRVPATEIEHDAKTASSETSKGIAA
jgi:hypothetical protein